MVILGLGSNVDDRLSHLRQALKLIKHIPALTVKQVSPLYLSDALLPENAPLSWDKPYFNLALRCETSLSPYELLFHTKQIEKIIGRTPSADWAPRVVDIDLLAWDDFVQYDEKLHIPHEELILRPFALWPLADVAPFWVYPIQGELYGKTAAQLVEQWGSRFSGKAPFHTKQIPHRLDTPQLVGILNITPDSFSNSHQPTLEEAIEHAKQSIAAGAEILDIGAEATGPKAQPISPEEEWLRLEPILQAVINEKNNMLIPPKISIDTRNLSTAKNALNLGVDWINDVSGVKHPDMQNMLVDSHCNIVFMHNLGIPTSLQQTLPLNKNPVDTLLSWAEQKLEVFLQKGIAKERLIFDPGIGFGKTAEQSWILLQQIECFKDLGIAILIGHSRKSFFNLLTDKLSHDRDLETTLTSLFLAEKGIDFLRVHDVGMHAQGFKVMGLF